MKSTCFFAFILCVSFAAPLLFGQSDQPYPPTVTYGQQPYGLAYDTQDLTATDDVPPSADDSSHASYPPVQQGDVPTDPAPDYAQPPVTPPEPPKPSTQQQTAESLRNAASAAFGVQLPAASATNATEAKEPVDPKLMRAIEVASQLTSPRDTMKYFIGAFDVGNSDSAIYCMDFSDVGPDVARQDLAHHLRRIIASLGSVDLESIPENLSTQSYEYRPNPEFAALYLTKQPDGAWRFSSQTVQAIEPLYELIKDKQFVHRRGIFKYMPESWRENMPEIMFRQIVWIPLYQWVAILLVILLGVTLGKLVQLGMYHLITNWVHAFLKTPATDQLRDVERRVWKPMGLLVQSFIWYHGACVLALPPTVLLVVRIITLAMIILMATWTVFRLIDLLAIVFQRQAKLTRTKLDDLLLPLLTRSLKILAVCLCILTLALSFGWPIVNLLSGLMGIGGVAIAFAAKDTIANMFGSVTVLVDRPFDVGDWVVTSGVEGSIESVGMRSTKIRTFYNSLITVPNSLLTTATIDNMGRRRYRRLKTTIGLQYDTPPDRIEAFCEAVRELLRRHPHTRKDYYHVYLNNFSASSLDVMLYCFFSCPNWSVELRERERLLLDIMRVAELMGVLFAFPTQTVHLQTDELPQLPAAAQPKSPHAAPQQSLDDATGGHNPIDFGRLIAARVTQPLTESGEVPGGVEFGKWHPIGDSEQESDGDS